MCVVVIYESRYFVVYLLREVRSIEDARQCKKSIVYFSIIEKVRRRNEGQNNEFVTMNYREREEGISIDIRG